MKIGKKFWQKYGTAHLRLYYELLKIYDTNAIYKKELEKKITDTLLQLVMLDEKNGTRLAAQAASNFPDAARLLIMKQQKDIRECEQLINILKTEKAEQIQHAANLQDQLSKVVDSRAYKLSRRAGSLKHRISPKLNKGQK